MDNLILVIEDSVSCQKIAIDALKKIGSVDITNNLNEARLYLTTHHPQLILLDLNLPDGNGFDFFEELQTKMQKTEIPVIFVSGSDDVSHKVAAFSAGALDYVVKPYSPLELRARAARIFKLKKDEAILKEEDLGLTLDLNCYRASLSQSGKIENIDLTPNEFKILALFIKNRDRIFSRQQIIDSVWGLNTFVTPRTVDTHISTLRKKIRELNVELQSIRGEGYRLETKLRSAC